MPQPDTRTSVNRDQWAERARFPLTAGLLLEVVCTKNISSGFE